MPTKTKREKLAASFFLDTGEDIRKNITIDPNLQNLIPPLADEEFEQLRQNIIAHGCRDPLVLWRRDGGSILVDGHNRYRICTENNIAFEFRFYDFDNLEQAKDWMLTNQLGRRNLTPFQQSYLRGKRYANEKQAWGGLRLATGHNVHLPTATQLAEEYGVNEKTIRRDEQFAIGLEKLTKDNDHLRWQILNGEVKAGKKTIAYLSEESTKNLKAINKKLKKTNNVDQAVQQFRLADQITDNFQTVITPTLSDLKKQIVAATTRAIQTSDPSAVNELRKLVDDLAQALNSNLPE